MQCIPCCVLIAGLSVCLDLPHTGSLNQRRPVSALCDAELHHGQSRGKRNTHKVCKKQVNFTKSGGFAKAGGK